MCSLIDMFKTRVSHVVHGIERFLDLMPEPLVLRAMEDSDHGVGRK